MAKPRQLPSGKWRVQIRKNGLYRNKTFITRKAAAAWEAEMSRQVEQIDAMGYVQPKGLTLGLLIDLYMDSPVGRKAKRSKAFTMGQLQKRIGDVQVDKLNPVVIRDFVDKRELDGVQGATIAGELSYLSVVLKWAKQVRHINCTPELATDARAALTQRGLRTRSSERDRIPSPAELKLLQGYFDASISRIPMWEIVCFALASAMRRGEIMAMTASMVDIDARTVTMARKDPRHKDANIQRIPMPRPAMKIIVERLEQHPQGRLFPYRKASVSANFVRACEQLGIEDLRFHDLRHAATVSLFRAGLDIPRVAMITGHRSWENLKRYTNLDASDVHSILDGAK